jgi:hypothetical protein
MSNQYEIEYQVIMRGGKALVVAPSYDDAIGVFYSGDEGIKQLKEPSQETTVKRVTKLEG